MINYKRYEALPGMTKDNINNSSDVDIWQNTRAQMQDLLWNNEVLNAPFTVSETIIMVNGDKLFIWSMKIWDKNYWLVYSQRAQSLVDFWLFDNRFVFDKEVYDLNYYDWGSLLLKESPSFRNNTLGPRVVQDYNIGLILTKLHINDNMRSPSILYLYIKNIWYRRASNTDGYFDKVWEKWRFIDYKWNPVIIKLPDWSVFTDFDEIWPAIPCYNGSWTKPWAYDSIRVNDKCFIVGINHLWWYVFIDENTNTFMFDKIASDWRINEAQGGRTQLFFWDREISVGWISMYINHGLTYWKF